MLSAAMEEVIAANSDTRPEQLPNIHITNGAGTNLKGHPAFLDIALDKELLDLVSCVIGDDIVMWGCQIFCKPGSDGMEVPMHQDGQYWPIRPLATCTVWLAIDDSDRENGCLTVIPGSHRDRVHFRHRNPHRRQHRAEPGGGRFARLRPRARVHRARARATVDARHLSHPRLGAEHLRPPPGGRRDPVHADDFVVPARSRDAVLGVSLQFFGPTDIGSPADGMSAARTTSPSDTPPRNRSAPQSPHSPGSSEGRVGRRRQPTSNPRPGRRSIELHCASPTCAICATLKHPEQSADYGR